ncbi:uncharacterized protein LOC107204147 [Parus major]|uniref:uncharacterized protein LOC107204147 n=1 Tax=Parus major TaxID=9157 RepID=UPI001443EB22|nr:uncharacterized protein LOC107204147 [Parus major]
MQSVADSRSCVCGGRPAVGYPGEAGAGLTLPGRRWGKPPGIPVGNEATLLAPCPSPARRSCSRHPSLPPCLPPAHPRLSPPAVAQLSRRGPFSLAPPGRERSLTHPGWDPAGARGSSLIPSPCTRGRRATLLQTHLAPGWPGVLSKADQLLLPCPTSWIGLCPCI